MTLQQKREAGLVIDSDGVSGVAGSPVRPVASGYRVGPGSESWPAPRRNASSICEVERGTPPRRARRRRGQSGFTLLEVLIALAILSMAIVVSIQGFASGLRLLKLSGEHQEAMLIADLKAREITSPTQAGRDSGTEGAFTWEREVKQVVTPDLDVEGRTLKWRQWEVDVRVSWGDHRQVMVATLRTVAGDGDNKATTPKP
jgi:general secretion pathway protein I